MLRVKCDHRTGEFSRLSGRGRDRSRAHFSLEGILIMKTVLRTAVAGLAIASLGISSTAFAATETTTADAEIIAALDIQLLDNTRDSLDFGVIAEGGTGGTLSLTPAGVDTCGAGLVCAGPFETPLFTLDGEANAVVNLSITDSTIDLVSGANTMPVSLTLSAASATLDGSGTNTFEVGGTLTVGANQAVGVYTETFEVVAVYN